MKSWKMLIKMIIFANIHYGFLNENKMTRKSSIDVEKVTNLIVKWLKDYAQQSNVKGFVIGISGGVDSAVTSALCAKTGYPVLCVEMPIHQAQNQISRGKEHIDGLKNSFKNVTSIESNLTALYDVFVATVQKSTDDTKYNLSLANTRARLRMTTLYYYAGVNNFLVVGTGNKVEDFGVGFYTKYGDGGVDLSPIADLMKSDVYALGAYLKIPDSILVAAPTDGLFGDSRTDEDQLGASYDELEWAMSELNKTKPQENYSEREKTVLNIYKTLNANNNHKMIAIPVCKI